MFETTTSRRSAALLFSLGCAFFSAITASSATFAEPAYREYDDGDTRDLTDEDIRRLSIDRNRSGRDGGPDADDDDDDDDENDDRDDDGRYDGADEQDRDSPDGGETQYYDEDGASGGPDGDRSDAGGSFKDGDVAGVDYFYSELESDGRWFEHETYGTVWTPHRVADDWRPYSRGHWVMTDDHGWYWESDEPFGWATYHYGRWAHDRRHGWIWVPGTRWGPAWVAWRESADYIGWAPLPPDAYWEPRRRTVVMSEALYEGPEYEIYWSFLPPAHFLAPSPWRHYAPRHDIHRLVRHSRPHTHYGWRNRAVYNRGVPAARIARATHRPVPRHRTSLSQSRPPMRTGKPYAAHRSVEVYRPDLARRAAESRRVRPDTAKRAWYDVDRRAHRHAPARSLTGRTPPDWTDDPRSSLGARTLGLRPPAAPPHAGHASPPKRKAAAAPRRPAPPASATRNPPASPRAAAAAPPAPPTAAAPPPRGGVERPWKPDLGRRDGAGRGGPRGDGSGGGPGRNRDGPPQG